MMNMMEATDSDAEFATKGVKTPLWSGAAYSSAISKSMRAIMPSSRLRTGRQQAAAGCDMGAEPFADAVARKDKEKILDAIAKDPSILRRSDADGWLPLHHMCALRPNYRYVDVMTMMINTQPDAVHFIDKIGRTPLHILCGNSCVTVQGLGAFAASLGKLAIVQDSNGNLPLHCLCRNSSCDIGLIKKLGSDTSAYATINDEGQTPLHCLVTADVPLNKAVLHHLIEIFPNTVLMRDLMGRTILHWVCERHELDQSIIKTLLASVADVACLPDVNGDLPLHILCQNEKLTRDLLHLALQAYPTGIYSLAKVGAVVFFIQDFKLPVQYLVDNPSSSPEMTALLICGPASYRHRYEFLSISGQCICFTLGAEVVYAQANVAMDSNTSTKVLVNFYSSQGFVDHEQKMLFRLKTATDIRDDDVSYSPTVYETFENAKRRLTLRRINAAPEDHNGIDDFVLTHSAIVNTSSDATVMLDYALVMEAPLYTLEGLRAEKLCDTEGVRAIATEVANCLLFWHCDARMVHGNITLQNVGQFEDRGLCFYSLSTSRELYQQRSIGFHAIALTSCPPEAAKAFVGKEEFLPTQASDMWQFGCLVYQLLTGSTLLERLAPWSGSIGHEQGLHLICSLTEAALESLIAETAPAFRLLLQRTLVVNPSYRWGIDRLLRIEDGSSLPSFATSEAPSHDFVGETLHQRTKDALADGSKGSRSVKHAQEQLEFMKKEQSLLRHTLLSTKSQLRDIDQARVDLQLKMEELRSQMTSEVQQRQEAQLEAQLLARNHQAMTLQLHTTVQMLLNLVPLARKVYGAAADDFLSGALAQATGGAPPAHFPSDPTKHRRKSGPVELLKTQLQHSVLAHGCVQKWASSSPPSSNVPPASDSNDDEEKSHSQTEDPDSSAAAMA
ncbi:hypothetical protein PHYPSEUDO_011210 [Phytophthora pseudosyringae]|uniref:Protein kinase domain-containing protein n=1 Tax=Phytophthora pseudosyringae TaxID=221518 RepID=A0A8T1WIZ1_9STRA|nr:hypothetical protein PHYPSEUDO_011210 [Phytophthora pseudosyringae]